MEKKHTSIVFPMELRKQVEKIAEREERSLSSVVIRLVRQAVAEYEQEGGGRKSAAKP